MEKIIPVEPVHDIADQVKDQAEVLLSRMKEGLEPVDEWVRTTARTRPLLLLGGAFGIGYVVARLLHRR